MEEIGTVKLSIEELGYINDAEFRDSLYKHNNENLEVTYGEGNDVFIKGTKKQLKTLTDLIVKPKSKRIFSLEELGYNDPVLFATNLKSVEGFKDVEKHIKLEGFGDKMKVTGVELKGYQSRIDQLVDVLRPKQ